MKGIEKARMGMIAVLALMLVSITRRLPEARRLSPGITTLALAGIVLLVAAGSASADTEINVTTFGGGDYDADIANERYYLTAGLTADADKGGIIIGADGVTIDGQGHYISGGTPGSCPGIPMLPGEKGGSWARPGIVVGDFLNAWELATIQNIEVKNFCTGILLYGSDAKNERHIVENCNVHDNGNPTVEVSDANFHGIALYKKMCNCTINNNTVYNNCGKLKPDCDDNGAGISLRVCSNDNDITNNTCYNNTLAGIYSKSGGGNCYNRIFNNIVYENGATGATATYTGGIRFQCKSTDWNAFENNIVWGNFGPGIFIGGHNCTLRNNTATDNKDAYSGNPGYGLWNDRWDGGSGGDSHTQLYDNTFCNNEGDDIRADAVGQNVTGDRNTCDTGSNYQDNSASGSNVCEFSCTEPPTTFTKSLAPGWNLISLPLTPSDNSVSGVLDGVAYTVVHSYNATSKEFECPSTMDPGIGYFVDVTSTSTWEYEGAPVSSTSPGLTLGLNMIGVPNCTMSVSDAMGPADYRYVVRWNAADQKYEVYTPRAPATFNGFTTMAAGEGYFVSAKSDDTEFAISCP